MNGPIVICLASSGSLAAWNNGCVCPLAARSFARQATALLCERSQLRHSSSSFIFDLSQHHTVLARRHNAARSRHDGFWSVRGSLYLYFPNAAEGQRRGDLFLSILALERATGSFLLSLSFPLAGPWKRDGRAGQAKKNGVSVP